MCLCCVAIGFTELRGNFWSKQRVGFDLARLFAAIANDDVGFAALPAPRPTVRSSVDPRLLDPNQSEVFRRCRDIIFNTRIGDELISDPDGEVLGSRPRLGNGARHDQGAAQDRWRDGALLSAIIEVTDDDGEIVLEFPFAEAILDAPAPRLRSTEAR